MSYSVRKIELESGRDDVLGFWRENFPTWPSKKYNWLYEQNVFGRAGCWTLLKENRVVGSAAVFPRDFIFRGRRLRGGITGDVGVDRRDRMMGPALQLLREIVDNSSYDFIYGLPNRYAEPIHLRAGFRMLGTTVRMVRVLRADQYLAQRIRYAPAARILAAAGNVLLDARRGRQRVDLAPYRIDLPVRFDDRFDALWHRAATAGTKLLGIRNRDFLNRRFVRCPYIDYHIVAVTRRSNHSVVGYVVYRIVDRVVHVSDCLAEDMTTHFDILLSAFVDHVRMLGFQAISMQFLGDDELIERLKEHGFSMRRDRRTVVVYAKPSADPAEDLLDRVRWYFWEADND